MNAPNHRQGEWSLSRQDFGNSSARTDQRLELLSGPAELFTPDLDGVDWRERSDEECPALVGIDQRGESIELTLLARTGLGIPKFFNATKSLLVSSRISDGFDHVVSDLVGVDAVVARRGSYTKRRPILTRSSTTYPR